MAHVSDQLRRVTPDGREDLGLAAAFEIGRLLALSQPSIVSSLARWRREEFGRARAMRYVEHLVDSVAIFDDLLEVGDRLDVDLGRLVSRRVVLSTAADREAVLAPNRPIADPGRPISFLRGDLDGVVIKGLGLNGDQLGADIEELGLVAALARQDAPAAVEVISSFDDDAAEQLRDHLTGVVESLATDVLKDAADGAPRRSRASAGAGRDALDELLRRARRRRT